MRPAGLPIGLKPSNVESSSIPEWDLPAGTSCAGPSISGPRRLGRPVGRAWGGSVQAATPGCGGVPQGRREGFVLALPGRPEAARVLHDVAEGIPRVDAHPDGAVTVSQANSEGERLNSHDSPPQYGGIGWPRRFAPPTHHPSESAADFLSAFADLPGHVRTSEGSRSLGAPENAVRAGGCRRVAGCECRGDQRRITAVRGLSKRGVPVAMDLI
jgi:hypothetical protein